MPDYALMRRECLALRNDIVDAIHNACSGHAGGSLSCVEILWSLYSGVMRVRPDEPGWADRDRFILSKGHGAPALYAVLAKKGYFPAKTLAVLRRAGSILQGHPDMMKTPGVDMSTGSLGMGISVGVGMALAARVQKKEHRTFILAGDGELQEGQNWEGMMAAAKFALSNLVLIVDWNGVQLDGTTDEVMPLGDLEAKIRAFGFDTKTCDGHDCREVTEALSWACKAQNTPRAILARTVKGKGVSFMEGQNAWHGKQITNADYARAKLELQETA